MKAKSVLAATVAAMTIVGVSACGGGDGTNADGKTEVVVWMNSTTGDGKKFWEDAAAAFEKEHANVDIKVEAIQNEDMDGKLQTALQDPSSAPDVFLARGGVAARSCVTSSRPARSSPTAQTSAARCPNEVSTKDSLTASPPRLSVMLCAELVFTMP